MLNEGFKQRQLKKRMTTIEQRLPNAFNLLKVWTAEGVGREENLEKAISGGKA